jgi:hypothetical protein
LSLALLGNFLDPNAILGARRSTLARFIGTNASGNHPHSGPFVDQLIDRLKMAARETLALHGDAIDFTELQFEVRHEVDQCIRLLDAVAELDKRIDALYRELHPTDALRSIPGVGLHLAPVLLGVLHTADRFRGERHVRGFCGMFPTRSASGASSPPSILSTGSRLKVELAATAVSTDYLTRLDFVILDELGYLPFAQAGGQLLFHLISPLYERTSVVVTTNLSFDSVNGRASSAIRK